ncbi:L10-interacting MYB domain-containing-like protein [Cinnamomum micranthum f. kanehirae]|uniref:L10-interacting MYB domain-containing-like protein n=1 Tax=Cinnamomum micranthum f. kanehirae TaxID=337451 RepID=A0A3S3M2M6_9MAGN|nr:L10-interacting MYB domain-containing-like protein [Cinnamomum micranthum f. kanehirae]
MVSHEVEEGEDDDRRSRINKKRSIDSTPSSSRKSKKEAKGVGEKMANQIDHLIEVVATRQLGDEESTRSTPTIIDCIKRLDAMDQVNSGSELYFYAVDLFSKKNYRMTFMGFEKPDVRLKWLQQMYAMEHSLE